MRSQRQMPRRPLFPRPLRQEHRNQSEEQPRHLQPNHARKPRHRRPYRPPQLPGMLLRRRHSPLRLHHFLCHAISLRSRFRRALWCRPRPPRRRRRRRIRRLHQRLRRMPSAIPQCASEPNPVHALQCTVPRFPHRLSSPDLYPIPISCIQPLTTFEVTVETRNKGASNEESSLVGERFGSSNGRFPRMGSCARAAGRRACPSPRGRLGRPSHRRLTCRCLPLIPPPLPLFHPARSH